MKYKRVRLSIDFIMNILIVGNELIARCVRGLPEGTKFCYAYNDNIYGIWFVVEHESFPSLKDGDIIPEFGSIEMEKIR